MSGIPNKRDFYRVQLKRPLCGECKIIPLDELELDTKFMTVAIFNISAGGLKFATTKPIQHEDYHLLIEIKVTLFHEEVTLMGEIVRKGEGPNEYCIEYTINDTERTRMVRLVNNLSVQLRKTSSLSSCSFCTDEQILIFKQMSFLTQDQRLSRIYIK